MSTFAKHTTSRECPAEVATAAKGIEGRLSWPSMHWGAEDLHPDALPHIAAAALDAALPTILAAERERIAKAIEAGRLNPDDPRKGKFDDTWNNAMAEAARIARTEPTP